MNKRVAVILASYDGVVNNYCGVGTICQSFIKSFHHSRKYAAQHGIELDLHLIAPLLLPDSLGYKEEIKESSIQAARANGGDVHFVINGSDGMIPYGTPAHWEIASAAAAQKVTDIAGEYDEVVVFVIDEPFARAPYLVNKQKSATSIRNIKYVLVFQGGVFVHEPDNPSIDRLAWEGSVIQTAACTDTMYIADIGTYMTGALVDHYGIPEKKLVPLRNGLNPDHDRFTAYSQATIKAKLEEYDIPTDKPLAFSVARAVDYKGFDILIKAFSQVQHDAHLVFVASPYKTEASVVGELKELLRQYPSSCTPIFDCDFELPKYISQWKNTVFVAQLAKYEPFGLVPEEVRLWARNQGPVILASKQNGFVEQIDDGIDGFLTDIDNVSAVARKMDAIFSMDSSQLRLIRQKGYERFFRDYDYRLSLFRALTRTVDGLKTVDEKAFASTLPKPDTTKSSATRSLALVP